MSYEELYAVLGGVLYESVKFQNIVYDTLFQNVTFVPT